MDQRMIAYCGLDCSECEAYQATKKEDIEKLKAVAEKWSAHFVKALILSRFCAMDVRAEDAGLFIARMTVKFVTVV